MLENHHKILILLEDFCCHLPGIVVIKAQCCVTSTFKCGMLVQCSACTTVPDHPHKSNILAVAETSCRTLIWKSGRAIAGRQAGLGKHRPLPSASSGSPLTTFKCGPTPGISCGGSLVSFGPVELLSNNRIHSRPLRTEAEHEGTGWRWVTWIRMNCSFYLKSKNSFFLSLHKVTK